VGKKTPANERPIAVGIVHVDGKIPERVMQEIRKIDAVVTAKAIRL
jgi:hypothetical protein